ncbi:MAG: trypsin-like serine peptidase [Verrucomicrobiales bacterium]
MMGESEMDPNGLAVVGDDGGSSHEFAAFAEGDAPEPLPLPSDIPSPVAAVPAGSGSVPLVIDPANDQRKRVTKSGLAPIRSLAAILAVDRKNGGVQIGTGWFFSPGLLVTAGHVLFDHNHNLGKMKEAFVLPMHNNSIPNAKGLFEKIHVSPNQFRLTDGWVKKKDRAADYAAIVLPESQHSSHWCNTSVELNDEVLGADQMARQQILIAGYPAKPPAGAAPGTMWIAAGKLGGRDAKQISYRIDTSGGQSGTAVFLSTQKGAYVLGIHNYGIALDGKRFNQATRINKAVFLQLAAWAGLKVAAS